MTCIIQPLHFYQITFQSLQKDGERNFVDLRLKIFSKKYL